MSLTKQFKTNEEKESQGVPVTFAPNDDGTLPTFYLARQSSRNAQYVKTVERVTKPYRRQIDMGTLSKSKAEELNMEVFVTSVLTGWQNVKAKDVGIIGNDDNADAPFNKDNAKALFTALPELYDTLNEQSRSVTLFQDEELEADAKN